MNFLEKLDELKRLKGDNNSTLSKKSGIPYTTIDGLYKKGYENMRLSTLYALSRYFDVSMDYLANDEIDIEDEMKQRLVNAFENLNDEGKRIAVLHAEFLTTREEFRSSNSVDKFIEERRVDNKKEQAE